MRVPRSEADGHILTISSAITKFACVELREARSPVRAPSLLGIRKVYDCRCSMGFGFAMASFLIAARLT